MPVTIEDYLEWTARPDDPEYWRDGTAPTDAELANLAAVRRYHRQIVMRRRARGPQRRAMRLLHQFLGAEQREQLRRSRQFLVTTAAGHTYRIMPRLGFTHRVTRHGKRWFAALAFCLHDDRSDPSEAMPPADLALAHMLLLLADEEEFLRLANARNVRDQLWNREYLRRLRSHAPRTAESERP